MDYRIRPLTADDEVLLWDMLHQALHTSEGAPPREIIKQPEFARYVDGWGRAGDMGFVAFDADDRQIMGAVWIRTFEGDPQQSPQLAFAVKPGHRRRGIGAALLTQLVKANPDQSSITIRAASNNPAVRLYERFGFKVLEQTPTGVVMRREA